MPSTFSTFPLVFQLFLSHRRPLCQTFFNFKKSFLKNLPLALSLHMKLEGKSSNSIKNILNLSMQTHPVLGYSYPRVTLEGDWPSFWWNQHPKFSQLLLYFLKLFYYYPDTQPVASIWVHVEWTSLKMPTGTKSPKASPQSSLCPQRGRQGCLWCCPSFCATPPPAQSRVSNPKHAALLFLTGRSRSQLPKEFQREHSICTRAGRMDVLSLLSLKETRLHQWKFHQGEKKKK